MRGVCNMFDGNRLREVRILLKVSQRELGEKIGLSRTTVARYEACTTFPDDEIIEQISQALDVSKYLISSDHSTDYYGHHETIQFRTALYNKRRIEIEKGLLEQLESKGVKGEHFYDLIKDYMALWDMKNDLIQDIKERGVSIEWSNGDKQSGFKKNDSISEMHKTSTQMLKILQELNIKTSDESGGDPFEDF